MLVISLSKILITAVFLVRIALIGVDSKKSNFSTASSKPSSITVMSTHWFSLPTLKTIVPDVGT